ncbi:MAG TPA: FHA domain-containing protein [Oligoflexia bacterium]|nr:FHA domain-containing protein [Oligoflexia bacterium]HMR25513.1 FHA domain-containing protein [Oligoflexia bacterium]
MNHFIRIISQEGTQDVPLSEGKLTLGRGEHADIQIVSQQISRIHAELVVTEQQVTVLDKGSANGTAVNGRFITTCNIQNGDQILLGDIVIQYHNLDQKPQEAIRPISQDSKTKVLAATKVIADKIRPRSLFPFFLLCLSFGFLLYFVIASTSYQTLIKQNFKQNTLDRAYVLVQLLAERNKNFLLEKDDELLIDTQTIKEEALVLEAFIIDKNKKVLAPINYRNRLDKDTLVEEALSQNSNKKLLPRINEKQKLITVAHPIRVFNKNAGQFENLGVAKLMVSMQTSENLNTQMTKNKSILLLLSLVFSLLLTFLLSKVFSSPITKLAEYIHKWRSGETYGKEETPFKEWEPLYEAVDQAMEEKR